MSVLIKNMRMPNTCEDCNLESFCDLWVDARKMTGEYCRRTTIRHPDCPLIVVPEPNFDPSENLVVGYQVIKKEKDKEYSIEDGCIRVFEKRERT